MTGKTWKQKLTKKQRKHLNEMKIYTKHSLEVQKAHLKKEMKGDTRCFVCYECIEILKRLGMWDD